MLAHRGSNCVVMGQGATGVITSRQSGVKNQENCLQKRQLLPLTSLHLSFREILHHRGERDT